MKKISLLLVIIITTFSLVQCKSQDSVVQKDVPFTINKKTYQYWTGGKEGSSGTDLIIKGNYDLSPLHFDSIFFHNKQEKVSAQVNSNMYTIYIRVIDKKDLNMSNNPVDEYGNPIPATKSIPFDLKEDEAVLVYNISGKEYYYKITGIVKLDPINYP